jgi:hypothetical protein
MDIVHQRLDQVSHGMLRDLAAACRNRHLKPYMMVEKTGGEMRLITIAFDANGKTSYFKTAKLPEGAHSDGWKLMGADCD